MLRALFLLLCLGVAHPVYAVIETYEFSDPALELRYQRLSAELRCPKCQNQNIADSNAPISQDLRKRLHQQLEQGATDEQILEDMVNRYGEFVRYRPRFGGATLILWFAPVFLLLIGAAVLVATVRRRKPPPDSQPAGLSAEDEARVRSLLNEKEGGS